MEPIFSMLLFSLLATPLACNKGAFAYLITSSSFCKVDPVYGVGLERTIPAVDLALDYINFHSDLFPAINLTYGSMVNSLECPVTGNSLEEVLHQYNYGIFGYSSGELALCDVFVQPLFNFTPMVTYAPTSTAGLLRSSICSREQPVLFSIHPTSNTYALAILSFLREFKWQRLSIITEDAGFFDEVLQDIRKLAVIFNVTVFESERLATGDFLIPEYLRIIFMNMNMSSASQVLCQASNIGYAFPDYIWITYAGDFVSSASSLSCNSMQLTHIVDGMFTIEPGPHNDGLLIRGTFAHINSMIQNISDFEDTLPLSYYAVDAVLVLAQAINASIVGWSNNSQDLVFCCSKMTSISSYIVRQKLLNISVQGLTGEITFNARGEREQHRMGLFQYRNEGLPSSILVGRIGITMSTSPVAFELVDGVNVTTLFRGSVPADSSPIKVIRVQPLAMIIVYYTLASAGIIFCFICFLFNIIFRKRKIVKLNSPNLNYFVVLGAFILYSSIYFRIYPSPTLLYANIRCYANEIMLCLGYTLASAPVLLKMCRVFYIFRNPSQKKKAVKDWHLFLGTAIIVGIIMTFLMISSAVPLFRTKPRLIIDIEKSRGVNENGIEIEYWIYQCYDFSPGLIWIGVEYASLTLIQVAAFVLAIVTRNVKIKVLNDSKEMTFTAYTTSIVMLVLGVIFLVFNTRFTLNEVLVGFGIMLATTILLAFVFVAKMVDLYKDP